ncbi:ankyrin repeat domain-containing protein [Endozoicomonas euniceicola]|uniref:Ankyrin repeat domain-containing protein n=1 Tax=Endozoicomonas euniceicola TaxID=1234143 RepID=A0ABY6H0S0_9GAMM|nr:ankyrin repeat domain-containing protein [Endozoicomonas euniceicola]UYM18652.1 ankyrin repeat domain-containing protein [Endozoicomonas euniceicola]
MPGLYEGARFGDELLPGLKHQQNDALPDTKATEGEYTSERLPESRSQPGFLRLSSPYTLNVDADSLQPAKGTACVTEALDSGQRKKWQCYSKQGGHHSVTVDIAVFHVDESVILLPANQDMTVQYLSLSEGEITAPPQFEFHQSDIAKAALKQSLQNKKKIDEAVQKASAMIKISTRSKDDDPSIKAIRFKLLNDISREDEQMLQEAIKNIRLGDRPEILKNTDDMFLLPDTTLQLSSHGLQFAGKISNLVGGKGGGAKSNSKKIKSNKKSSGKQPSTSSGASSSGASSSTSVEYKFKFSENCPYCQNQRSEKNLGTNKYSEVRTLTEEEYKQKALLDTRISEFDHVALIIAIKSNDKDYIKRYLCKFPHRIDALIKYGGFYHDSASPLSIAILLNKPDIVELLLEMGANVNQKKDPILLACEWIRKENTTQKLEIIHHLLSWGASPNVCEKNSHYPNTPLTYCLHNYSMEGLNILLSHGVNPNPKEPLTEKNQMEICRYYFKNHSTNGDFHNKHESLDFLKALLKHGFDLNRSYLGLYPIHIALIKTHDGTPEYVKELVDGGADVNVRAEGGGATPLHFALSSQGSKYDVRKVVTCLVSCGADPEIKGRFPESYGFYSSMHDKGTALKGKRPFTALELADDRMRELIESEIEARRKKLQAIKLDATGVTGARGSAPDAGDSSDSDSEADDIPTNTDRPSLLKRLAGMFGCIKPETIPEPSAPPREDNGFPEPSAPPREDNGFPEPSAPPREDNGFPEPSAPPREDNDFPEPSQRMPEFGDGFYNVAPPPYSEEDPNPSPFRKNKRF